MPSLRTLWPLAWRSTVRDREAKLKLAIAALLESNAAIMRLLLIREAAIGVVYGPTDAPTRACNIEALRHWIERADATCSKP